MSNITKSAQFSPLRPGGREGREKKTVKKDYYLILGVCRSESTEGIKSAFRKLAKRYHPDKSGPEGTRRFQDIAEAYEVLSHPEARRRYTERLLSSERASRRARFAPEMSRFRRVDLELLLSEHEAETGGILPAEIFLASPCPVCEGSGEMGPFICPACGGRGMTERPVLIRITIPPNITAGSVLEGRIGTPGQDLLIRIHVRLMFDD